MGQPASSLEFNVERLEEYGDTVGVITEILYRGRGSGIEVPQRMGMLFTIREGN